MSTEIDKFTKQMKHKLHEIEHRLESLKSETDTQLAHADKAIRQHVETLEQGAEKAKHKLDHARADMTDWVEDGKEAVADWKAKVDVKMLQARADRSEHYAEAALTVAMASLDHAEKAMLSAAVARIEASVAA